MVTGNFDLNVDANTLVVDGSANEVGIGVADPSAKLDVNGNARVRTLTTGAASDLVVTADANGNLRFRSAADVAATNGAMTTASNGLTKVGSDVKLGGTLSENTSLITGAFDLNGIDANTLGG